MSAENEIQFADASSGFWAEIILPLALPTTYTYAIPEQLFAKSNTRVQGRSGVWKKKKICRYHKIGS